MLQADNWVYIIMESDQKDSDCFVAYNMHWIPHEFALPALPKGKKWYRILSTESETGFVEETLEENQKETTVEERTIVMFLGK